jgi:hypothetical protein
MVDINEDDSTMKNVGNFLKNSSLNFRNERIENSFQYFNNNSSNEDSDSTMKDVGRFMRRTSKDKKLQDSDTETVNPRENVSINGKHLDKNNYPSKVESENAVSNQMSPIHYDDNDAPKNVNSLPNLNQSSPIHFNINEAYKNSSNSKTNLRQISVIHSNNNDAPKNTTNTNTLPNLNHSSPIHFNTNANENASHSNKNSRQTSAIHSNSIDGSRNLTNVNTFSNFRQNSPIHPNNNDAPKNTTNANTLPNLNQNILIHSNTNSAYKNLSISNQSSPIHFDTNEAYENASHSNRNSRQTSAIHSNSIDGSRNLTNVNTFPNLRQNSPIHPNNNAAFKNATNINTLPNLNQTSQFNSNTNLGQRSSIHSNNNDASKIVTNVNTLLNIGYKSTIHGLTSHKNIPILPDNNYASNDLVINDYVSLSLIDNNVSNDLTKSSSKEMKSKPMFLSDSNATFNNSNNSIQNEVDLDSSQYHHVQKSATASLLNDLLYFYKFDSDIKFKLKNTTVKVHKAIMLARSLWFNKSYQIFLKNKNLNCFDSLNTDNYFDNISLSAIDFINDKFVFQIENVSVSTFKELSIFLFIHFFCYIINFIY